MKRKRGTLPTKEDFESRYLLPPEGKGMTLKEIANYYGVHRATVKRWRKNLGYLSKTDMNEFRITIQVNVSFMRLQRVS